MIPVGDVERNATSRNVRRPMFAWGMALFLAAAIIAAAAFVHQRRLQVALLMMRPDAAMEPQIQRFAVSEGAYAYARYCIRCHGRDLHGDRGAAIPDLADSKWLYGSGRVSDIERTILYGIRSGDSRGHDLARMPGFARPQPYARYEIKPLSPGEIDAVLAYVLALNGAKQPALLAAEGKAIFHDANKGMCADCHGFDAKGDSAIGAPDLTDNVWLRGDGSSQTIRDTIERGLGGSCPAWGTRLSAATVRVLAVYIHSRSVRPQSSTAAARAAIEIP